jgi:hypothetical protein
MSTYFRLAILWTAGTLVALLPAAVPDKTAAHGGDVAGKSPSIIEFSSGNEKVGQGGVAFFHPIGQGHVGPVRPMASAFTTKVVLPIRGTISNLVAEVNFIPTGAAPGVAFYGVSADLSPSGSDFHLGTNIRCIIFSHDNTCRNTVDSFLFDSGQGVVVNFVPLTSDAPIAEATASVLFTPE